MGERWIQECNDYLKQIKEALSTESPDRLDLVRAMYVSLLALSHSVWGWLQYVNNPEIMGKFSLSELNEVNSTLGKFTLEFLEYDIKATKMGMEKGLRRMVREGEDQRPSSDGYLIS
ncbi:DUF2153 family protein [Candidatus Bathyarchaeota archaeon]|nr:DUF2153 family protein [Candidatus Bathyarchaeota archaeon]